MTSPSPSPRRLPLSLKAILKARCPACHRGAVLEGIGRTRARCPHCEYDFHPESGFYLGAMMMGFLLNMGITIPPMIALKLWGAELAVILAFPFIEFATLGLVLIFYARIVWLHVEYRISSRIGAGERRS